MEKKKEYSEPKMQIVHLESQINLLGDSHSGEFGLAPHEQDPIA